MCSYCARKGPSMIGGVPFVVEVVVVELVFVYSGWVFWQELPDDTYTGISLAGAVAFVINLLTGVYVAFWLSIAVNSGVILTAATVVASFVFLLTAFILLGLLYESVEDFKRERRWSR